MADPKTYTVGWICALPTEFDAAQAFLDEEHEDCPPVAPNDNNNYALGKIGRHNVVIAVLPDREYGTNAAGAVARDMLHSFPNVRIGLMVGIGGGAPSPKHDVRLGDVVVSSRDGGKGGVFQYDFGKAVQDQDISFQHTDFLDQPPMLLRTAVSALKSRYKRKGHQLNNAIDEALERWPRLRGEYSRPPPASDRLYRSEIIHPQTSEGCAKVCSDDPTHIILRAERVGHTDDPAIHYGLIASANQLMKNATIRDKLAAEYGVACFEMEAAGLMNHFPCLIIRGICDYSDSHKNKAWQGFAAMVAAAYAKDLLRQMPPERIEAEKRIGEIFSSLQEVAKEQKNIAQKQLDIQTAEAKRRQSEREAQCLQLFKLTTSGNDNGYESYKRRVGDRVEGTCQWFLSHSHFKEWLEQESGPLLVSADPGCGKSVLAKYLVDQRLPRSATICYFFFHDQDQDTVCKALCALLHQLFSQNRHLIQHAHEEHEKNGSRLVNTSESLWKIFHRARKDPEAGSVIIVLDALDECAESDRSELIRELRHLFQEKRQGKWKCLLTSRPYGHIISEFEDLCDNFPYIRIPGEEESETISQEVSRVVLYETNRLAKKMKLRDDVKDCLEESLLKIPHRTYLWAYLVIKHLEREDFKRTKEGVKSAVETLPRSVNQAYEQILKKSKNNSMIRKVLSILFAASRPLTLAEMNVAVNIEVSSRTMESLDLEADEDFKSRLRSWCGLFVSIHQGKVYFLHQTAREFLQQSLPHATIPAKSGRWQHSISTQEANAVLMKGCQMYLLFAVFEIDGQFEYAEEVHKRLNGYAFLRYSAQYWLLHFKRSGVQGTALPESILETATAENTLEKLNLLSIKLGDCYQRWGIMDALWIATGIAELAVSLMSHDQPNRAAIFNNLGVRLGDRYLRTGGLEDLEEAIFNAREAVKVTPDDHPSRARWLDNLGVRLGDRYSRTGAIVDLEEAIRNAREAVQVTPEDHPSRAGRLDNLGLRLGDRYSRTGAMADLEEAIRISREAIEATPEDHPDRAGQLNNLGLRLGDRYSRTGAMADLEEAIHISREAVEATPEDHPSRSGRLNNLGVRLGDRYSRTGAMADLELAIRISREAVEATPEDHPSRAGRLDNLGVRLGDRYSRTGAMADLELAICISREAVKATPEDHPDRAGQLNNLGLRLGDRYSRTGAMEDLRESRKVYTTALNSEGAIISTRILAGRSLLSHQATLQDGLEAYHIAQTAISLVPLSAPFSLQSADKQHLLSHAVGLASDAAAVALHVGQGPLPAIELLETGRGVIASSLQDIRTDLSSLEKEHPNLAKSFVDLRNLLDAPVSTGSVNTISPVTSPSASPSAIADQRHQASSRMTALLSKIRQQPGFETFLIAATEVQMREAAAQGPIVVINVSRHRCDALIIEQAGVQVLQLHQLTREDILSKAGQSKSLETLSWLWTVVAKPVLDALGFTKTPADDEPWSHVWWIPTGPLVRFPLHAAGYHLQGNSETVLDRVVSSYSPSIKSIIDTRQQNPKTITDQTQRIVLVAMGETPGNSVLQYAVNEVDAVRDICILNGVPYHQPEAYLKEVLDALDTCHIFHFAGHGSTDLTDPLQSRLLLKDWQETPMSVGSLLDKTNLRSTSPFLAYLSACGTGQVLDDKSVDESIHLTSAFQLAGFRHVIGTLWEVDDALCAVMARMTYEYMSEKGFSNGSVAYGLHYAMRTLRDQWVGKVECSGVKQKQDAVLVTDTVQGTPTWIPYVHYGV